MEKDHVIAVDIGATWVRTLVSDIDGDIKNRTKEKIDTASEQSISGQIISMTKELCRDISLDRERLKGVGIASAGPLDADKGILVNPTNIPFERVPLFEPIEEELGLKAKLLNDGAAAALGEKRFGHGEDLDNLVYVTLSTGIGGGAIVDGNLLSGKDGNAAEIGHFTIDINGDLVCGCGRKGHWESFCSGANIPRFVEKKVKEYKKKEEVGPSFENYLESDFKDFQPKDLFDLAKNDDPIAKRIVDEIGRLNAIGFGCAVEAYDPSLITVGGSIALNNPELVLEPIRENMDRYSQNRLPRIRLTALGEDIVIYGAVALIAE